MDTQNAAVPMVSSDQNRVLLVEDDKFISRAYKDGLTRAGFIVETAFDGNEALEKIGAFSPHIVMLDLIMPIKNGFEVLTSIKENASLSSIPIIVLSNLGQETDIQKAKELGAIDYMIKSNFSIKEVVVKLRQYIK